jgi:hypothetical protein
VAETDHLRVLIANEKRDPLDLLAHVVAGLEHEVMARELRQGSRRRHGERTTRRRAGESNKPTASHRHGTRR